MTWLRQFIFATLGFGSSHFRAHRIDLYGDPPRRLGTPSLGFGRSTCRTLDSVNRGAVGRLHDHAARERSQRFANRQRTEAALVGRREAERIGSALADVVDVDTR